MCISRLARNPRVPQQTAEVTVFANGTVIRAQERSENLYASIDLVAGKLSRQLRRHKDRHSDHHHSPGHNASQTAHTADVVVDAPVEGSLLEGRTAELPNRGVRRKYFAMPAMSLEDAMHQLDVIDHDFDVFRDSQNGSIQVVYRRNHGGYWGDSTARILIQPCALPGASRLRDLPDLAPLIDHALLDPHQGSEAVLRCCDEARHFGFAGVCLASRWLPLARERLGSGASGRSGSNQPTRLISVVGFPFGAIAAEIKWAEAEWAAAAGADELDVVPDFGALADGDASRFCADLEPIVELGLPVKVILEVGRLSPAALALAVAAAIDVGVAFLKTRQRLWARRDGGAGEPSAPAGPGPGSGEGLRRHRQPGAGPGAGGGGGQPAGHQPWCRPDPGRQTLWPRPGGGAPRR
jgi:deoxyribose-phosphate aldolase